MLKRLGHNQLSKKEKRVAVEENGQMDSNIITEEDNLSGEVAGALVEAGRIAREYIAVAAFDT